MDAEEQRRQRERLVEWAAGQSPKDTPVTWLDFAKAGFPSRTRADRERISRTLRRKSALWRAVPGIGMQLCGPGDVGHLVDDHLRRSCSEVDKAATSGSQARSRYGAQLTEYDGERIRAAEALRSVTSTIVRAPGSKITVVEPQLEEKH